MNPKFVKSVADRNGIRNEYLKNLQLETSNNLTNYNANQIFKQTGQLPPSITALLDTRSITEKYADKQKARIAVLSGLREITDGANANAIIDQIQGNDIIDLLNSLPQIIAEIKPKWSLGITAPAFMSYWNNYKKAQTLNAGVSTLAVLQSNQLLTSIEGLLQNIQATIPTKRDYQLMKSVFALLPQTEQIRITNQLIQDAEDDAETIYSLATEISTFTTDPILKEQMIQQIQTAMENMPPKSVIQDLTQQANIAVSLGNSPQEANYLAQQSNSQLSIRNPNIVRLEDLEEEMESLVSTPITPSISPLTQSTMAQEKPKKIKPQLQLNIRPPRDMEEFMRLPLLDKRAFVLYVIADDPEFGRQLNKSKMSQQSVRHITWEDRSKQSPNYYKNTNVNELLTNFFNSNKTINPKSEADTYESILRKYYKSQERVPTVKSELGGAQESKSTGTEPLEPTAEQIKKGGEETTGSGIKKKHRIQGRGVNANRTHAETTTLTSGGNYRRIPKVDTSHKVEKVPSYIEFGKHLLHQHNLRGGILQIRRHSGNIINELPRQAIGGKLKNVLIKLTGTGSPSFEDINELTTHEKEILNKVVKHCKIDQRLLVPTPDKTKEEQDMNRLQILSGEITAGNNAPQLVKELKTLLLRLKNSGRIPKREAHEIMEDLLTLGY